MIYLDLVHTAFVQPHCDQDSTREAVGPSDVGKGFDKVWLQ